MYRLEFEVQFKRRVFIFPAKYEGATNDPLVGLRKQRISRRSSQLLALFSSYPLFLRSADSAKIIPLTPSATQTQMLVLGVEGKGHPYCHTHSKGFISYLFILHFIKRVFFNADQIQYLNKQGGLRWISVAHGSYNGRDGSQGDDSSL